MAFVYEDQISHIKSLQPQLAFIEKQELSSFKSLNYDEIDLLKEQVLLKQFLVRKRPTKKEIVDLDDDDEPPTSPTTPTTNKKT